jgi:DNA-binding NarL/FixJ family response regulator
VTARAKVLLVDDHPLVREGLAARIAMQPDLEVCGEAADVDEALALLDATDPAVVTVDITLKSGHGLDLIKKISGKKSRPRVLVVSAHDEALFAERALRAGAHGYVNKHEAQGTVIDAIRTVLRGERYLSAEVTRRLVDQAIAGGSKRRGIESLSDRELEIFELIGDGESTSDIARRLHLSVHTVETHRENIRIKLNLRRGTELVRHAVQWVLERK